MFNQKEIELWEQEQTIKVSGRYCTVKNNRLFDPKKERLFKARKYFTMKYGGYNESWSAAKEWKRHIRAKYRNIKSEDACHPTKHEYHTYGYLTW